MSGREEYLDEPTGTRMTIEHDEPFWPRITIFPPQDHPGFTFEHLKAAVGRLRKMAGLPDQSLQQQEGEPPS